MWRLYALIAFVILFHVAIIGCVAEMDTKSDFYCVTQGSYHSHTEKIELCGARVYFLDVNGNATILSGDYVVTGDYCHFTGPYIHLEMENVNSSSD